MSFVFATLYASPRQYTQIGQSHAPLAIGLVNSVHMLGSFWIPIGFAFIADRLNYQNAWIFLGLATVAFTPLILLAKEPFKEVSGH